MTLLETYHQTKNNTDKEGLHYYISNLYCEKLTPKKNEEINILEIGIFKGDSLKLWDDFFINANIYGMDLGDYTQHTYSNKVKKYIMNAYEESTINFLKNTNIKFDIIIDDGPHTLESQDYACKNYRQFLKDNGILIIEDVAVDNLPTLQKNNPDFITLDLMHIAKCFMDNIILYLENK